MAGPVMANDVLRAEHDEVLSAVSARESTRQFAHAAVGVFIAILLSGTAGKLWWDLKGKFPWIWMVVAGAAALAVTYALIRVGIGLTHHRRERALLKRLQELRAALGL